MMENDDEIIISFENISVYTAERGRCYNRIISPIGRFAQQYLGQAYDEITSFYAIRDISGYLKAGECCLMLGPSGSGRSSLMKAITCRLSANDEIQGDLYVKGDLLERKNYDKWRRVSNYVSSRDDEHNPFLTVYETFYFAAQCSSDGTSTHAEIDERVEEMLLALGLTKVRNTIIGNENNRGISGGQKRRVTIGEMLINPNVKLLCMDYVTNGLASTDSLELINYISFLCKLRRIAVMLTLQQPSDEIVYLFDNLIILTQEGELNYFGPVDRNYLSTLFPSITPESEDPNDAISDIVLRQSAISMRSSSNIPSIDGSSQFQSSKSFRDLQNSLHSFHSGADGRNGIDDQRFFLPKKPYVNSYWYQLKIILYRKKIILLRNQSIYFRPFGATLFSLLIGSLFSELTDDTSGARTRDGYVFLIFLLTVLIGASSTISEGVKERVILFKHRSYLFYSGTVAHIAEIIFGIPLTLLESFIVSCTPYHWVGMRSGTGYFLFFFTTILALEMLSQAIARGVSSVFQDMASARNMFSLFSFCSFIFCGYFPSYGDYPSFLQWLNWATPYSYAYEGLLLNQYQSRFIFDTVTESEITGEDYLKNELDLPRSDWGSYSDIQALDISFVFLYAILIDVFALLIGFAYQRYTYNKIQRVEPKVRFVDIHSNLRSKPFKGRRTSDVDVNVIAEALQEHLIVRDESDESSEWPKTLTVEDLSYSIDIKLSSKIYETLSCNGNNAEFNEQEVTLLHNVTAQFKCGNMTAIMGPSGCGKSTMLDVIAGYKSGGKITGSIQIDGHPKTEKLWRKISCYAEQNDILQPYFSVLETLQFTANCRLAPTADKKSIIKKVISLMGLQYYTNLLVGRENFDEGLPKHVRRRLTIANELVAQPKILFLDEPTTGLDSDAAGLILDVVRQSTDSLNLITVATVHQPSKKMFECFDDLLLLVNGGRVAYMGPTGFESSILLSYLKGLSDKVIQPKYNPAVFVLETIEFFGEDASVDYFRSTSFYDHLVSDIEKIKLDRSILKIPNVESNYTNKFLLLLKRHFICDWRNIDYLALRYLASSLMALTTGLVFSTFEMDVNGVIYLMGVTVFISNTFVFLSLSVIIPLVGDRAVMYRETKSGSYSRFLYAISKFCVDIPLNLINALLVFVCYYFIIGQHVNISSCFYAIVMCFVGLWLFVSIAALFTYASPNEEVAITRVGLLFTIANIFLGVVISRSNMPEYWIWLNTIDFTRYIAQGLSINAVEGSLFYAGVINGVELHLPGEYFLYSLSWAYYDEESEEYKAPYKWHYCVTTVIFMIIVVETLKLFSICFLNWTKR